MPYFFRMPPRTTIIKIGPVTENEKCSVDKNSVSTMGSVFVGNKARYATTLARLHRI
jgi:hypothetical protein